MGAKPGKMAIFGVWYKYKKKVKLRNKSHEKKKSPLGFERRCRNRRGNARSHNRPHQGQRHQSAACHFPRPRRGRQDVRVGFRASGAVRLQPRPARQADVAFQCDVPQEDREVGEGRVEGPRQDIAGTDGTGQRGHHAARLAAERPAGEEELAVRAPGGAVVCWVVVVVRYEEIRCRTGRSNFIYGLRVSQ